MAKFSGTRSEFDKFIGPRLRNVVQTSIARKLRNKIGKCEECGKTEDLQAAHVHGADRKTLTKEALKGFIEQNKIVNADIEKVEKRFKELHKPPKNVFKILCRQCHNDYDKVEEVVEVENLQNEIDSETLNKNTITLPIELFPEDISEFKELLLKNKRALITIYYNDGSALVKEWNASRFSEDSDVIRNLRSRTEFRSGNWEKLNIKSIKVEIDEIELY